MDRALITRKVLKALAAVVAGLVVLVAVLVVCAALIDPNHFRGLLIHYFAARTGRQLQIGGPIEAHLFARHPRLSAERVVIGNPPWLPPGRTLEAGKLMLAFNLPTFAHPFSIRRIEMTGATLNLTRDAKGRANWQWSEPDKRDGKGPPFLHSISMPNAHVTLDDVRRHLKFDGIVSAQETQPAGAAVPLRIEGAGQLNGKAATVTINGDPLATASRKKPYRFSFVETSSGSRLSGQGFLSHPFDFRTLDSTFVAEGADLRDLYFLTGLTLIHTGPYHLTGKLARRDTKFEYDDLVVTSGKSDVRGKVSIETSGDRAQLVADLNSQLLRLSDLGAQAAGAPPPPAGKPLMLPDTRLDLSRLRRRDAVVNYHARALETARLSLHTVAAKVVIDKGVIAVSPMSAVLTDGKIKGRVRIDVTGEQPAVDADLTITDLQLSQFHRKGTSQSLMEGLMLARVSIAGHGSSIHEVAASGTGTLTAVVPRGAIRSSMAELTAIDLRGLGLMLARSKSDTPIRCAVASFQARDGTLTTQNLVIDTEPVLIGGSGTINLDSEALDLVFRGQPKNVRIGRVRAPVALRGTLSKPSMGVEAGHSMAQAGGALALGILFTPLASVLAFVDPGLAKDADCAALLANPTK